MKILTIVNTLGRGGTERAAELFTRGYREHGHDVFVLARNEGGRREESLAAAGVKVAIGGTQERQFNRALEQAQAFDPTVVHIHRPGMGSQADTHILETLNVPGRTFIETNVFGRVDYSPSASIIDVHLQLSNWCLWRWHRWLPRSSDAIGVVVPNPVECIAFSRASQANIDDFRGKHKIPLDAYVMGRIGQKIDGKWHPAMIDAFAKVAKANPRAYLVTIGLPPSCKLRLNHLPIAIRRRAVDLGFIDSDEELAAAFSAMDVFLHAAQVGESFGYVLVEAMLCEVPVITAARPHKDNSQVEVVGHEQGGLVTASTRSLAEACLTLQEMPGWRRKLGKAGRRSVIDRFDYLNVAGQALRIMEHSIASNKNRAELRKRLETDKDLTTHVLDADIRSLLNANMGTASSRERWLHRALMFPGVYRQYKRMRGLA